MDYETANYPRVAKLGLTVRDGAVFCDELNATLLARYGEHDTFWEYFGVQTGVVVDDRLAVWASDVESVLYRLDTGRLTGTQLFMD